MPRRSPALILVHIVWATARRQPVLPASLDERLLAILGAKARELRCALLVGGCAPDHVHVIVRVASSTSVADLAMKMKGASSFELNHAERLPRRFAWQHGYWAESFSPADLDPIARYLRAQRERHDASHPAERWSSAEIDASHPE